METILMIIATLSLVAFVVGMFSPKAVKCSSRGKVALIFFECVFSLCYYQRLDIEETSDYDCNAGNGTIDTVGRGIGRG